HTTAMVPRMVLSWRFSARVMTMAPASEIAEMALVSDMRGVCRSGLTRRITSKPTKVASTNTNSSLSRSDGIGSASFRGQPQRLADPRVDDLPVPRQERLTSDFVREVEPEHAVLHQVEEERRQVLRVHLARVGGHGARQVHGRDDGHAALHHGLVGARQLAV